jgi:hypothetical protein
MRQKSPAGGRGLQRGRFCYDDTVAHKKRGRQGPRFFSPRNWCGRYACCTRSCARAAHETPAENPFCPPPRGVNFSAFSAGTFFLKKGHAARSSALCAAVTGRFRTPSLPSPERRSTASLSIPKHTAKPERWSRASFAFRRIGRPLLSGRPNILLAGKTAKEEKNNCRPAVSRGSILKKGGNSTWQKNWIKQQTHILTAAYCN